MLPNGGFRTWGRLTCGEYRPTVVPLKQISDLAKSECPIQVRKNTLAVVSYVSTSLILGTSEYPILEVSCSVHSLKKGEYLLFYTTLGGQFTHAEQIAALQGLPAYTAHAPAEGWYDG